MAKSRKPKYTVQPGDKFGHLTVIREVPLADLKGKVWRGALCRCTCGTELAVLIQNLHLKKTRSCGCHGRSPDEVDAQRVARRAAEQALRDQFPSYRVTVLMVRRKPASWPERISGRPVGERWYQSLRRRSSA